MAQQKKQPGKPGRLRVTLRRSIHGRHRKHVACVRGLGLRRIRQTVEVEDTAATRGMINKASYLLEWEVS